MNKYKVYYNDKQATVEADTLYAGKLKGIELFKPPKSKQHMVSVVLVEKGGDPVPLFNSNADLG